jgi:hypothetical protein
MKIAVSLTDIKDVARRAMLTAKECLQNAEVCLALAHKTKELDTRAALLEFAYEFRTVAKRLEREERKLIAHAAAPSRGECVSQ